MAKSTASARQEKAASKSAWEPPYPDFPLSFHPPSGRLYKKIKGKRVYFGYASDWQSAVDKYGRQREDLYAGRKPRPERDGLPLVDLINRFLTAKLHRVESGELTQRSWNDYKATCGRVLDCFGKRRVVEDLRAEDFETLRADLQKSRGLVALGNEIQRIRTLFKYGWDSDLIASPVKYGPDFKRPGKKARRRARNQREPLAYSPDEIHRMLEAATPQLRAMFLLAINTGMGNHDIAQLPIGKVDLERGWHTFGRPKTGVERRCPLWPETVAALREVLKHRPEPKNAEDANLVFLTRWGRPFVRMKEDSTTWNDAISRETGKLLRSLGIHRKGLNFYSLRRTFRTIADSSGEQTAAIYIMGHADSDNDMSATYRQYIDDDRLQAVVNHVHEWLFRKGDTDQDTNSQPDDGLELRVIG